MLLYLKISCSTFKGLLLCVLNWARFGPLKGIPVNLGQAPRIVSKEEKGRRNTDDSGQRTSWPQMWSASDAERARILEIYELDAKLGKRKGRAPAGQPFNFANSKDFSNIPRPPQDSWLPQLLLAVMCWAGLSRAGPGCHSGSAWEPAVPSRSSLFKTSSCCMAASRSCPRREGTFWKHPGFWKFFITFFSF